MLLEEKFLHPCWRLISSQVILSLNKWMVC